MRSKYVGAIFIIVSSIIGAGMLALPLLGASIGYIPSLVVLAGLWVLYFGSTLAVLELSLALPPYKNHFNSIAKATLQPFGQLMVNLSFLLLLYSIVGAYIAGGGSLLYSLCKGYFSTNLSESLLMLLFTVFLGSFIFVSTKAVDYALRFLMSIKGVLLIIALVLLVPHVSPGLLTGMRGKEVLLFTFPVFLVTLSYNVIIPSLVNYMGNDPKVLIQSILMGSLIPLVLFIGWLTVTLGIIPYEGVGGFHQILTNNESLAGMMSSLREKISNPVIFSSFDAFSNIALWASFLALGLALFDYIADAFDYHKSVKGRLITSLITFLPPLTFAIIFPQGFIYALNFTALAVCTLQLILPPLMVYRMRKALGSKMGYKAPLGNVALLLMSMMGVILFILSLINIINP